MASLLWGTTCSANEQEANVRSSNTSSTPSTPLLAAPSFKLSATAVLIAAKSTPKFGLVSAISSNPVSICPCTPFVNSVRTIGSLVIFPRDSAVLLEMPDMAALRPKPESAAARAPTPRVAPLATF